MKKSIFVLSLIFTFMSSTFVTASGPLSKDEKQIQKIVESFVKAGDKQDVSGLESVLHDNYRIVWNDTNAGEIKTLDRATYLHLIGEKKFGGDKRSIRFDKIEIINESNATVKVFLDGEKADFSSFLSLVKDQDGWKLVQDLVMMQ